MGKILHVINSLEIGGAERVAIDLCIGLSQRGKQSILATIEGGGPLEEVLQKNHIYYKLMNKKSGFRPSLTYNFLKLFSEHNVKTIISHNYSPLRYSTVANIFYNKASIIHVHHARSFEEKNSNPISERFLYRFAKHVVAVSSQLKSDMIHNDKINPDKISVIANGIDENTYNINIDKSKKREDLNIDAGKLVLGVCARLSEQKGHTYLLQALAELNRTAQHKWQLLVIGDGPLKNELQNYAAELGISAHISFLGARMDVPELLKVIDIFILPSIWEGMPLTILEAMAAGKAIIASNVGGVPEVLENEVDGIIFPSRDIHALSIAIKRMMESEELRMEVSSKASQKFLKEFSLKRTLDKYEQLLPA